MSETKTSIKEKDGYLIVTEFGDRTNLLKIVEDVKTVYEAAKRHQMKYILADFSRVNNDVPITEAYNLVKIFENKFPDINQLTISYLANVQNLQLVRF